MRYIREARLGKPKTFKTGAILGTYPKPMLVCMFDNDGHSVIPSKSSAPNPDLVKMDTSYEDMVIITPVELPKWLEKPMEQQPRILVIDFFSARCITVTLDVKVLADSTAMQAFVNVTDALFRHVKDKKPFPWKTIVFDSTTGFSDVVLSFVAQYNAPAMANAMLWAPQVAGKVRQAINFMNIMPAHAVTIIHVEVDKDEMTGAVSEIPSLYSKSLRTDLSGLFNQVFYSTKRNGKPVVWTTDQMLVTGIGPRWPQGLPTECGADFASLYGKEGLV